MMINQKANKNVSFWGVFLLQKHKICAKIFSMQNTKPTEENAVFVDVQGTLVKGGNILNKSLYADIEKIQDRGATVFLFTIASPLQMAQHLQKLGVDTKRFPVKSKLRYRGHLFTGIIVDDIAPHLQGFLTRPSVYDASGQMLNSITKQLDTFPHLSFQDALKNYRAQLRTLREHSKSAV